VSMLVCFLIFFHENGNSFPIGSKESLLGESANVLPSKRYGVFPKSSGRFTRMISPKPRSTSRLRQWARRISPVPWVPVSRKEALEAEIGLFNLSRAPLHVYDVDIDKDVKLHTVEGGSNHSTTVVCTAGYGAGLGFFFRNYRNLTSRYHVYAVDLLGWGLSSRPPWPKNVSSFSEAENFFVESLEKWRKKVNLTTPFILLGHSFGGYLATAYASRFEDNVQKLLLAGPAGINEHPVALFRSRLLANFASWVWKNGITPGDFIRKCGPIGRRIVRLHNRMFFQKKKSTSAKGLSDSEVQLFNRYTYHITALPSSGERSLRHILQPGGVAFAPMGDRLMKLEKPVGFIYGRYDWADWRHAHRVCQRRKPNTSTLVVIDDAAHHVYLDQPEEFCHMVSISIDEQHHLYKLHHITPSIPFPPNPRHEKQPNLGSNINLAYRAADVPLPPHSEKRKHAEDDESQNHLHKHATHSHHQSHHHLMYKSESKSITSNISMIKNKPSIKKEMYESIHKEIFQMTSDNGTKVTSMRESDIRLDADTSPDGGVHVIMTAKLKSKTNGRTISSSETSVWDTMGAVFHNLTRLSRLIPPQWQPEQSELDALSPLSLPRPLPPKKKNHVSSKTLQALRYISRTRNRLLRIRSRSKSRGRQRIEGILGEIPMKNQLV